MKINYKNISKVSNVLLNWGAVLYFLTNIIFKLSDWRIFDIVNEISQYFIGIALVLYFIAENIRRQKGDMVKVWIETEKIPPSHKGHIGRYFYFPAHAIPRAGDKIRVEDESLPSGSAFIRITDKQFVFIKEEFATVKLYCLV